MISENNSHTAEICVRVITPPTLGRDVFVTVMTEDGTATGNLFRKYLKLYVNQQMCPTLCCGCLQGTLPPMRVVQIPDCPENLHW